MYVSHVTVAATSPRPQLALRLAIALICANLLALAAADADRLVQPITAALVIAAVASAFAIAEYSSNTRFSPTFIVAILAIAFTGPAGVLIVLITYETAAWLVERYRWRAFVNNLAAVPAPFIAGAFAFEAIGAAEGSFAFYAALTVVASLALALNIVLIGALMDILDGRRLSLDIGDFSSFAPTIVISSALAIVVTAGYIDYGMTALSALLIGGVGAGYMLKLVAQSREQTREYVNLSWGVLSSLVRTLNERDDRASRHSAAVARFSRDMADVAGLDQKEIELAHTAGLLHDIGKFALSDRVMERGTRLTEADWRGIRRHPDIGADLLRDIGVYGPVSEIVRCHHERVDGRGYPRGLEGGEIPEVAKIVAVAEVYDTLTAPDTYRTPMNSFEALRELRRVAGEQLESTYVEALATLLAGRSLEYRHADAADFDVELAMERRIKDAVTLT